MEHQIQPKIRSQQQLQREKKPRSTSTRRIQPKSRSTTNRKKWRRRGGSCRSLPQPALDPCSAKVSRGGEDSRIWRARSSNQATRVGTARRSLAAALGRGEGEKQNGKRRRRGSPRRAPAAPPSAQHHGRHARLRPRRCPPSGGAPAAPPTGLPLAKVNEKERRMEESWGRGGGRGNREMRGGGGDDTREAEGICS